MEEIQYPDLFDAGANSSGVSTGQDERDESINLFKEHPKSEEGLYGQDSNSDRETSNTEFKSTLRVNLHTSQKDQKIELSCLKTIAGFLNQSGGTLIVGVSDEGEPVGIEPDQFENEDKMSLHLVNLINDRIGPQYMMYIQPIFKDYRGKTALFVECSKSAKPVYVKDGNIERFYIRTGASTTELSASQTHDFIKQRF